MRERVRERERARTYLDVVADWEFGIEHVYGMLAPLHRKNAGRVFGGILALVRLVEALEGHRVQSGGGNDETQILALAHNLRWICHPISKKTERRRRDHLLSFVRSCFLTPCLLLLSLSLTFSIYLSNLSLSFPLTPSNAYNGHTTFFSRPSRMSV